MSYAFRFLFIVYILTLAISIAEGVELHRYEYSQIEMGVRARMVVYAAGQQTAEDACRAAFDRISHLNDVMSDYDPKSELMLLCSRAGSGPVPISDDLMNVLLISQDISKRSGGAFDVTVGPEVKLWRKARKTKVLPTKQEIDSAKKLVGWEKIGLDVRRSNAALSTPGMQLDLGGIGKGFACAEAVRTLRRCGVRSTLVQMGGDLVVSAPPPGKKGWEIENENASTPAEKVLIVRDCAVSTSGDTEQFVEIGGKRYSHIVDPRTGVGLTTRIGVTIIAPTGALCDGLTKVVSVLGEEKGREFMRQYPHCRVFIRVIE